MWRCEGMKYTIHDLMLKVFCNIAVKLDSNIIKTYFKFA